MKNVNKQLLDAAKILLALHDSEVFVADPWNKTMEEMRQAIAAAEQAQQATGASVNVENRTLELGHGLCVEGSPDGKMKVTCQFPHAPTWLPDAMTPAMMRAVQMRSELGAYAAANLSGAYDLFAEFWRVAVEEAQKDGQ